MNKEEILKSAQKEKTKGKEFENKASVKGSLLGGAIAIFLGIALFLLEYYIKGTLNIGLIAVGMSASTAQSLYEGVKTKEAWRIVCGVIEGIIALFSILVFISQLVVAV